MKKKCTFKGCNNTPVKIWKGKRFIYGSCCKECFDKWLEEVRNQDPVKHVSQDNWQRSKDYETEKDIHPCDHWDVDICMCKGSCGCHWQLLSDEERWRYIDKKGNHP